MEEIKEQITELLEGAKADKYAQYGTEWQGRAVAVLNEFYFDHDRYDDEIFETDSDEWDEMVKREIDARGARGVLFFLGKIEPMDEWAQLDGYGNAVAVSGSDMVEMLKDARKELEND